jgi:beta-galactosidase
VFSVPYQPGTLKAVNVENGKETDAVVLKTTGVPKRIRLVADRRTIRANRSDLAYITVEVVDERNQVVPTAVVPLEFSVTGEGEVAAIGNANPTDVGSFQTGKRKTFRGRCLVILRPTGKAGRMTLKASTTGLESAHIRITTR